MWWDEDKPLTIDRNKKRRKKRTSREPVLMVRVGARRGGGKWHHHVSSFLVVGAAIVAVIWIAVIGTQSLGRLLFTANEEYVVRRLDLASDGRLKSWHIREYANLQEGENIFALDLDKIRRGLESVPQVYRAEVRRQLPDTLIVRINERRALARLGNDKEGIPLAIDREGYVLGPSARSPSLPAITGVRKRGLRPGSYIENRPVQDALRVLEMCDTTQLSQVVKVRNVNVEDEDKLDIVLVNGTRVPFATHDMPSRLREVAAIIRASRDLGRTPAVIDATGDKNFPVVYR